MKQIMMLLVCTFLLLAACASQPPAADLTVDAVTTSSDQYGEFVIVGFISNHGETAYGELKITIELYDSAGKNFSVTVDAPISFVEAGKSVPFAYSDANVRGYKDMSVSGVASDQDNPLVFSAFNAETIGEDILITGAVTNTQEPNCFTPYVALVYYGTSAYDVDFEPLSSEDGSAPVSLLPFNETAFFSHLEQGRASDRVEAFVTCSQ